MTLHQLAFFLLQLIRTLLAYTKSLVNQGKLRYTYTNNSNINGIVHVDIN